MRPKPEETDEICEKCGAKMVVREGKFGKFLACPNYPHCKFTKPYGGYVTTCPVCGKGIIKKVSKKGNVFYSCSGYPQCDFIAWDLPAPHRCPKCGGFMKQAGKGERHRYVCLDKNCGHTESVPLPEEGEGAE